MFGVVNPFKGINRKGKITVAIIFLTLLSTYPYVFSRFFPLPNYSVFMAMEIVVLALVMSSINNPKSLPKDLFTICSCQILVFFILCICHLDLFYVSRFSLFVVISYFSLYVAHNTVGISNLSRLNTIWIAIQTVLGVVGFVLIFLGILHPLMTYEFGSYGEDHFFIITTSNSMIGNLARIAGYFDEPGALAQWGVYALVLNKISPEYNKKLEIVIIVTLMVTFSMAYFIQLTTYLLLFNYSKIKRLLPGVSVLALTLFMALAYIPKDSDLYYLTLSRFEMSGGELETNRDLPAKSAKKIFNENVILGGGYSNLVESEADITDNPYETLATSGILGTFALYLPLLVILLRYRKCGAWQAVIVLSLGYLQRPFHIQYIHYLMMFLLFLICYYNNKTRKTLKPA